MSEPTRVRMTTGGQNRKAMCVAGGLRGVAFITSFVVGVGKPQQANRSMEIMLDYFE